MSGARIPRSLSEMIDRLEEQLNLLDTYAHASFAEHREEFLPEIATKLRVLLIRSRHNRPLLLEVAAGFGITLNVTIDGPPGVRYSDEQPSPQAGDTYSLDAFFDLTALGVQTSQGIVTMTKRQLIQAWCQQLGGAHEDWSVDESLVNALGSPFLFGGVNPTVMELRNCTRSALQYGRYVVAESRKRCADDKSPDRPTATGQ